MANKFFQPGEQRAAKVSDLFATIAPRYDLINDLQSVGLHRRWKKRVVQMADIKPGDRALDVCCGTGDLSFLLADAGAQVTGVDFSEAMLEVANSRAVTRKPTTSSPSPPKKEEKAWERSPTFDRGDAMNLGYSDASFNVVTVAYGLRNLSSWERGLEEMWRVAKPGGRLLVLDFGKPDNRIWRSFYFGYLRGIVPIFGKLFCGDSQLYSYILESLKNYPTQHGVDGKMKTLGCKNIRIVNFLGGVMTINYGEK